MTTLTRPLRNWHMPPLLVRRMRGENVVDQVLPCVRTAKTLRRHAANDSVLITQGHLVRRREAFFKFTVDPLHLIPARRKVMAVKGFEPGGHGMARQSRRGVEVKA